MCEAKGGSHWEPEDHDSLIVVPFATCDSVALWVRCNAWEHGRLAYEDATLYKKALCSVGDLLQERTVTLYLILT